MNEYNHLIVEKKWQDIWYSKNVFKSEIDDKKKKYYILDMFPYPSGAGLHVGHPEGYTATDILARYKRMKGLNVLHPMGWDAFGLPAENYAIKTGTHPRKTTEENIATFKRQIKSIGFSYDWDREIDTTDPEYYKWTQWIFLKLFEKGLAYEAFMPINWCPSCKTGLANEEVEGGICDRCKNKVEKKEMKQWMLKITAYAQRLLDDLDTLDDWPEPIKEMQKNWIGRSEGCEFKMNVIARSDGDEAIQGKKIGEVAVYTTRIDTVFAMTYAVIAPDHKDVLKYISKEEEKKCLDYINISKNKSDLDRTSLEKEKTGVFTGNYVINPCNGDKLPLWIGDFVLGHYGTGAIMSVPAHDERDFLFAKKNNIEIKQNIIPENLDYDKFQKLLKTLNNICELGEKNGINIYIIGGLAIALNNGVIYRDHLDIDITIEKGQFEKLKNLFNENKFKNKGVNEKYGASIETYEIDGFNIEIGEIGTEINFSSGDKIKFEKDDFEKVKYLGYSYNLLKLDIVKKFKEYQSKVRESEKDLIDLEKIKNGAFTDYGLLVNSGEFSGLKSEESRGKLVIKLEGEGYGEKRVNYKLRDWVFSRQRYWGEPIPVVHCDKCGIVAVDEKDLPIRLPDVKKYEPTGTGESPLVSIEEWVNTKCPKCKGPAKRETNTMPQWAGSSWYYLRFMDARNKDDYVSKIAEKYWGPVDMYVGGAEHAVLHLLYSRFWHKVLYDLGYVSTIEPFKALRNQGMILAEDGQKMSKSLGNVINPDDVISTYGADTLRMYEMFMGPFDQVVMWDTKGILGVKRFLDRVWRLKEKVDNNHTTENQELISLLHKTIKKIGEQIEDFKFNTAISDMMIFVNELSRQEKIGLDIFKNLLLILSPFAPHITEELWELIGGKTYLALENWPNFDENLCKENQTIYIVQINGKLRGEFKMNINDPKDAVIKEAKEIAKKHLDGAQIKKEIFVSGKLVNFVI